MIYRPQFAYPTPEGCRDEEFVYNFDGSNTPLLAAGLSAGQIVEFIPLVFEQDAPFYLRGWKVGLVNVVTTICPPAVTTTFILPDFSIKLRDCYENDLMDGYVPACHSGFPMNPVTFNGAALPGPPVPLEREIYCPRGGTFYAFLIGGATLQNFNSVIISLHGVKRFKECH